MAMKIIGVTGNIAAGKSLVSSYFYAEGIEVIDADVVSREESAKGSEGLTAIVEAFGGEILSVDGELDRKKLADIIFSKEKERNMLNSILHPIIKQRIVEKINKLREDGVETVVVDAALLFEAKWEDLVNFVVVVYCDDEVRIKRLMKREGISRAYAIRKIQSQMNQEEKKKLADYLIDNSCDKIETKRQFDELFKRIKN